jgi:hypothetical protein
MDNNANIVLYNGLGDQLLDLIGFYVICKYLNYSPNVTFPTISNSKFAWGDNNNYDEKLFNFNEIITLKNNCNYYIKSPNSSSSLCPFKVYVFLKNFYSELSFKQISDDFVLYAKNIIKPSEIILSKIPNDIEKSYGIHLRKSDKIQSNNTKIDIRHISTQNEFYIITNKLIDDVKNIIKTEQDARFLIVSEDNNWKNEITNIIYNIAFKNNKQVKILDVDYKNSLNYNNYNSVLDMFCLSKCKEILQGVKYSSFSILASLLGSGKLRNYSHYTDSYKVCLIHSWSSVIEINNERNLDIIIHKRISNSIGNLITNIKQIYV